MKQSEELNLQDQISTMQSTIESLLSTVSDLKNQVTEKNGKSDQYDSLPEGYYFIPTDKLLIKALRSKILNTQLHLLSNKFRTVNFYNYHPQELAALYEPGRERVWYFFVKNDKSKVCNSVISGIYRQAKHGFWKGCTYVRLPIKTNECVGHKNFFCYFEEDPRAILGTDTNWVMQEYLIDDDRRLDGWSLCKMYEMDHSRRRSDEEEYDFDPGSDFKWKDCDFHVLELKLYHIFGDQLDAKGDFLYEDCYEEGDVSCHLRN